MISNVRERTNKKQKVCSVSDRGLKVKTQLHNYQKTVEKTSAGFDNLLITRKVSQNTFLKYLKQHLYIFDLAYSLLGKSIHFIISYTGTCISCVKFYFLKRVHVYTVLVYYIFQ